MQTNPIHIGSINYNKLSFFSFISCFQNTFSIDWLVAILGLKVSELLALLDEGVELGWLKKKAMEFFISKIRKYVENWKIVCLFI